MKKILFVAYQIPPISGPAVQRHLRFLARLPECGWMPIVLTIHPDDCSDYYPRDETLNSLLPDEVPVFRARSFNPMESLLRVKKFLYQLYANKHHEKEPVSSYADTSSNGAVYGAFHKVKDLMTEIFRVPDRQIGWYPFAVSKGLNVINQYKLELIYSSGNPWTAHLIANTLSQITGLAWVADFRDPWTLNPYKSKRCGLIESIESYLEHKVVKNATYIIANTKPLKENFLKAYPDLPKSKVVHISNGYNSDLFEGLKYSRKEDNRFVVSHVGSLYANRSPLPLLRSIALLKNKGLLSNDNFILRFVGNVSVSGVNQNLTINMGIDDLVQFYKQVPHSQALQVLAESDLLLIIQPGTKLQIPAKIFEYIAVGKPILALTGKGATADLIFQESLGVVANPNDLDDISGKLSSLFNQYIEGSLPRISEKTRSKFESRALTRQLAQLFNNCVVRNN